MHDSDVLALRLPPNPSDRGALNPVAPNNAPETKDPLRHDDGHAVTAADKDIGVTLPHATDKPGTV